MVLSCRDDKNENQVQTQSSYVRCRAYTDRTCEAVRPCQMGVGEVLARMTSDEEQLHEYSRPRRGKVSAEPSRSGTTAKGGRGGLVQSSKNERFVKEGPTEAKYCWVMNRLAVRDP